ncbi:MFS transporter [Asticcacaulis taihuensis]|uniref:Predicted arabinose efflux permease, MFS family n=1 Tax=Asticcacaulis taihuensis TaxID=260084 RepID=A0A1G4TCN3_9CAUL|nr:MFS transporter [Asticcacaulis taihuensis]SCW79194.1 Predicted arabinose efflux permease, MFS family [Asticcacaulis taihuensis]
MTTPAEPPVIDLPPLEDDNRHPLQIPDFRAFWTSRLAGVLGTSAQSAAIAWQVYEIARRTQGVAESALYVGLIGLAQFLTLFAFTLPAGIVADRHDRKKIVGVVLFAQLLLSLAFFAYSFIPHPPFWGLFALSAVLGACRAFSAPASSAIGPMLVPKHILPKAIAVNSMAFQTGLIVGPALGGVLVGFSPRFAYGFCAGLCLIAALLILTIRTPTAPDAPSGSKMTMLKEGMAYIWSNKVILGAISLDLFAVLLGGAVALMPIYVRDILHAGPQAFGLLRASPAIGAIITSFILSWSPIRRHAGPWMFGGVAVFGISTIVFGLSEIIWVSIAAMIVLGAADMISVYVRGTLVQIVTPNHMRGRVASVSYLFIGASNELGEFETGVMARLMGPVNAALFGGIGSLIVTGSWIKLFPALYKADKLE